MQITGLKLSRYRNYKALELFPCDGLNVFIGENGAGKTNILESIYVCAFGKSHRSSRERDLIMHGERVANITLELSTYGGTRVISVSVRDDGKRRITLDNAPITGITDLIGVMRMTFFSPEDLSLVKRGPDVRRRLMDMEIGSARRAYLNALMLYNATLKQRNALLKGASLNSGVLCAYDEQLSGYCEYIMQVRQAYVKELANEAHVIHGKISGSKESLQILYEPSIALGSSKSDILNVFKSRQGVDTLRGFTSAGIHRDDIAISLDGHDLRAFGSQGQQRTAALSLKLAALEICKKCSPDAPILLLDDVLSELDNDRQKLLLDHTAGCQAFLTSAVVTPKMGGTRVFFVKAGTVAAMDG